MKNLSFFVSAFALCASTSYAAINCGTLPSCASLGYSDTVSQCPKSSTGAEMVVKCPFDTTQGKCIREAAVGQIAYFSKAPDAASGWLLCDGTSKSRTKYPELAAFLDTQFCDSAYHLNVKCPSTGGTFAVPNYKGYFLRVSGSPHSDKGATGNTNLVTPQWEGLPNITGKFRLPGTEGYVANKGGSITQGVELYEGVFSRTGVGGGWGYGHNNEAVNPEVSFAASASNSIYGAQSGVTPPNIAVYAYIYAGKVVQ